MRPLGLVDGHSAPGALGTRVHDRRVDLVLGFIFRRAVLLVLVMLVFVLIAIFISILIVITAVVVMVFEPHGRAVDAHPDAVSLGRPGRELYALRAEPGAFDRGLGLLVL